MTPVAYTTLKRWVETRGEVIDKVRGTFVTITEPKLSVGDAREHRARAEFLLAELEHHLEALSAVRTAMERPTATPKATTPPESYTAPKAKAGGRKRTTKATGGRTAKS